MNANEKHNACMEKKRKYIHEQGMTPKFNKYKISIGFNCLGCRKHFKEGNRWMVTYNYSEEKTRRGFTYERNLGKVCSDLCYDMVVMRFS